MSLLDEIQQTWKPEHEVMVSNWASALEKYLPFFESAAKRFRASTPLDTYLTVSRARNPTAKFSLRFLGQEIAELVVKDDLHLKISKKHAATNQTYFGIAAKDGFPWSDARATAFRKHFRSRDTTRIKVGIPEHRIEAEFLRQMSKGDRGKFGGTLAGIQPVGLAGCRFQFPLPLSASSGKPKDSRGNIDILARRGSGRGTRLSVWELKAPNADAFPIEQSYIYAVTLLKVLRSRSGEFWYRHVFGFKGGLPKSLTVESVVAVSFSNESKKKRFEEKLATFHAREELQVGNDKIKLCVAYYDYTPQSLKMEFSEIG